MLAPARATLRLDAPRNHDGRAAPPLHPRAARRARDDPAASASPQHAASAPCTERPHAPRRDLPARGCHHGQHWCRTHACLRRVRRVTVQRWRRARARPWPWQDCVGCFPLRPPLAAAMPCWAPFHLLWRGHRRQQLPLSGARAAQSVGHQPGARYLRACHSTVPTAARFSSVVALPPVGPSPPQSPRWLPVCGSGTLRQHPYRMTMGIEPARSERTGSQSRDSGRAARPTRTLRVCLAL